MLLTSTLCPGRALQLIVQGGGGGQAGDCPEATSQDRERQTGDCS